MDCLINSEYIVTPTNWDNQCGTLMSTLVVNTTLEFHYIVKVLHVALFGITQCGSTSLTSYFLQTNSFSSYQQR